MTTSTFADLVHDPAHGSARCWLHLALVDAARSCESPPDGLGLRAKADAWRAMADAVRQPDGDHIPLGRAAEIAGPEFCGAALKFLLEFADWYGGGMNFDRLVAALADEIVAARTAFLQAVENRIAAIWGLIIDRFDPQVRAQARTWPKKVDWSSPYVAEFVLDGISRAAVPYRVITDPNVPLRVEIVDVPNDARELDGKDDA
ncbi:hypothetical protein [Rhodococcus koreensis]|uniref:hypothetical protein n=1 Tax=Rhodococcus koreensis TaxID=99653 RepID=UPI0036DF0CDE